MPGDPDVLMSGWVDLSWSDSSSASGRDPLSKLADNPSYTESPHKWMFGAVSPKSSPKKAQAASKDGDDSKDETPTKTPTKEATPSQGTSLDKALSTSPTAMRSRHMWMFGGLITDPSGNSTD